MSHTAIVPVKSLSRAKSRLHHDPTVRRDLARAFVADILDLLASHPSISRTVVVTKDGEVAELARRRGAEVLDESSESESDPLNRAIEQGLRFADAHWPSDAAVVVFSDLVLLDADGLTQVLRAAEPHELAFVRDADGTGTTLVVAQRPVGVRTHYGPDSAERHRNAGFTELTGLADDVRRDVDDLTALAGVDVADRAPSTARVLAHLSARRLLGN